MKRISKTTIFLILSVILAGLFLKNSYEIRFVQDDAYTTFRYVNNFIEGGGLVFNENEKVEGYTNFLWVMILSSIGFLKLDFTAAAQILSILFGLLTLASLYLLSMELAKRNKIFGTEKFAAAFMPLFMLVFTGGFIYWSVSAMETTLFVFLITLAFALYFRNERKNFPHYDTAIILLLAALTRPEGIFFALLIFIHYEFNIYLNKNKQKESIGKKFPYKEVLIFTIPVIIYTCFRLFYYGWIFPNTFYVKTGFTSHYWGMGIKYAWHTLSAYCLGGFIIVLPLLLFRKKYYFIKSFYLIVPVLFFISVIFIGGDVLPLHRFFLPILPVFYSYFICAVIILIRDHMQKLGAFRNTITYTIFVLIALLWATVFSGEQPRIYDWRGYEIGLVAKMSVYADWISDKRQTERRKVTVALSTIGAFSYYSKANVIDLIGLTDEYIAHNPKEVLGISENVNVLWKEKNYNADYVLARKPDYIIFPAGAKPSAYPEAALFSKPGFLINYYPQLIYSEQFDQYLPIFTRRDGQIANQDADELCSVKFVGSYIKANNLFLQLLRSGNDSLLDEIISYCRSMIEECPLSSTYAYTTIGYACFHAGDLINAEINLAKAAEIDEMNCMAHSYLITIYDKLNEKKKALFHLKKLKQYSPDTFNYFY